MYDGLDVVVLAKRTLANTIIQEVEGNDYKTMDFSIIVWLLCHAISWELRVVVARLMLVLYIM